MGWRPGRTAWIGALAIAAFQVMGSFGASDNQPERRVIDAIAIVLVLLGPAALAWRDRWPLVDLPTRAGSADQCHPPRPRP